MLSWFEPSKLSLPFGKHTSINFYNQQQIIITFNIETVAFLLKTEGTNKYFSINWLIEQVHLDTQTLKLS